jgi:hypothetical protein
VVHVTRGIGHGAFEPKLRDQTQPLGGAGGG